MSSVALRKVECEGGSYFVAEDAFVHPDATVAPDTKIWSGAQVFAGANIGVSCIIGAGVFVEAEVKLGDFCKVQRGVTLYKGVTAGDYVFFGPNATTTNDRNPRAFGPWKLSETIIETGASIGANATLIAGNRVGALSLVGAGAVVTRDVEPGSLVLGNPARFAGWVDLEGTVVSKNQAFVPRALAESVENPRAAIENFLTTTE